MTPSRIQPSSAAMLCTFVGVTRIRPGTAALAVGTEVAGGAASMAGLRISTIASATMATAAAASAPDLSQRLRDCVGVYVSDFVST